VQRNDWTSNEKFTGTHDILCCARNHISLFVSEDLLLLFIEIITFAIGQIQASFPCQQTSHTSDGRVLYYKERGSRRAEAGHYNFLDS
jgi:hypothetical protein